MSFPITAGTASFFTLSLKPQFKTLAQSSHTLCRFSSSPSLSNRALGFHHLNYRNGEISSKRDISSVCFYDSNDSSNGEGSGLDWPILQRWDVPWEWYTISLTSLACGLSFVLTGLVEAAALPYLGIQMGELSLDEKAEILFFDQAFATAVVLATLYTITNSSEKNPDDLYRYDLRDPFNLQKGWLMWAGVGFIGALIAVSLSGAALALFNGEPPERETDALVRLLPLIGSSGLSTACLVGITGVLAPVLEENVFRGFLMVAFTKWVPSNLGRNVSEATENPRRKLTSLGDYGDFAAKTSEYAFFKKLKQNTDSEVHVRPSNHDNQPKNVQKSHHLTREEITNVQKENIKLNRHFTKEEIPNVQK